MPEKQKTVKVMAKATGLYDNRIYHEGDVFNMREKVFRGEQKDDKGNVIGPKAKPASWVTEVVEKESRQTEYVPKDASDFA